MGICDRRGRTPEPLSVSLPLFPKMITRGTTSISGINHNFINSFKRLKTTLFKAQFIAGLPNYLLSIIVHLSCMVPYDL